MIGVSACLQLLITTIFSPFSHTALVLGEMSEHILTKKITGSEVDAIREEGEERDFILGKSKASFIIVMVKIV